MRFTADGKENLLLMMTEAPIVDYFQWQSLVRSLLAKGKFSLLSRCLDYTDKSFSGSPLKNEFEAYKMLDSYELEEAERISFDLTKKYRNNTDYQFLYAYVLSCNEKYKESNKALQHLIKKHKKEDGDIYSLLGYNSYLMSYGDTNSTEWENSQNYFIKAEIKLKRDGLPSQEVSLNLNLMDQKQRELLQDKKDREEYKYWLYNTPANQAHLISKEEQEDSQYLFCNLGSSPREGDLVFFVNQNQGSGKTRLFSLYTVMGTPSWNNLEGYKTPLKQLYTLNSPVELPQSLKQEKSSLLLSKKKQNYKLPKGIYQLSEKGISSLGKALIKDIDSKEAAKKMQEALGLKKAS